jgi:tripartite-type tricarboxylate transporter receptor subunit TctC
VSVDLGKVESDPGFKNRLATVGNYPRAMTPEETLAFVQKEQATWLPVLQKVNAK